MRAIFRKFKQVKETVLFAEETRKENVACCYNNNDAFRKFFNPNPSIEPPMIRYFLNGSFTHFAPHKTSVFDSVWTDSENIT